MDRPPPDAGLRRHRFCTIPDLCFSCACDLKIWIPELLFARSKTKIGNEWKLSCWANPFLHQLASQAKRAWKDRHVKSTSFCLWIKRILKIVETAIWFAFFEYVVALPSGAFGTPRTRPCHCTKSEKKNRGLGPENSITGRFEPQLLRIYPRLQGRLSHLTKLTLPILVGRDGDARSAVVKHTHHQHSSN